MIIDIHAHFTTAPAELQAYRGRQVTGQGRPTKGRVNISDDQIREALENNQLKFMNERGTDRLLFSPTAGAMGHHFGGELISLYWTQTCNELIQRVCQLYPDRFIGVCQLPQSPGVSPKNCVGELERCVKEFGFVGCNINPDPGGGVGWTPPLGDKFWYPLYEKLCELDVPGMMHVSSSVNPGWPGTPVYYINGDTTAAWQLMESNVFQDFPQLRLVIPHGGGAIPGQFGRYRGIWEGQRRKPVFEEAIKHLYFDTAIYSTECVETLVRSVGVDNVLFASELVGAVDAIDPKTGRWFDDTKPYVDGVSSLTPQDRKKIFEDNAKKVYPGIKKYLDRPAAPRAAAPARPVSPGGDGGRSSRRRDV